MDGILVVDEQGAIISYNKRFMEMWRLPSEVIASRSDELALQSVLDKLVDPWTFWKRCGTSMRIAMRQAMKRFFLRTADL